MAAEGAQPEGPPMTELESLQLKANNITDESLDSTRRMIALCEDVSSTPFYLYFVQIAMCNGAVPSGTQSIVVVMVEQLQYSYYFCRKGK